MSDMTLGQLTITLTTQDDAPISAKFDLPDGSSVTQNFPAGGVLSNRLVLGVDLKTAQTQAPPGGSAPLDGLAGLTGAWSFSRKLLSAFSGVRYVLIPNGGINYVSQLTDQSGNAHHFTDGGLGNVRPVLNNAGPNGRECADFDGTDRLTTTGTLAQFVTADSAFMVLSIIIDNLTNNTTNPWQNHGLLCDSPGYLGLFAKNTSPNKSAIAYNYDSAQWDAANGDISLGTPYVLTLRHEGGVLYLGVNGVESQVPSGPTSSLAGQFRMGEQGGGTTTDCKVFEAAIFSTPPNAAARAAIVADFMAHLGLTT